jgi:acetoin utilization deacetylase AcuC-like enzyme
MSLIVLASPRFAEHETPPGHPESSERAEVMDVVASAWRTRGEVREPRAAEDAELLQVHAAEYLQLVASTHGRAVSLDPDTYTSADSYEIARLAAGATIDAGRIASAGGRALALVRPPGHHAERDRAMGFCLFNNVAAAAADLVEAGVERVAVVDYDVHHGNGTQWIFYTDPRVLYVSIHQYPFYPGTGAAQEVGAGAGQGFTLNVPVEVGATDADYLWLFDRAIVPVLDAYAPQTLLVSAGFDAHRHDPLAGMRLTVEGYSALTQRLLHLAERHAGGAMAVVTEGGYNLRALGECLNATVALMAGEPLDVPDEFGAPTHRAQDALRAVRAEQARFWRDL